MGKFKDGVSNAGLMAGNTIATPFRRGGELANAGRNIERQVLSGAKNIKEIQIQGVNALVDNFLNFSKVTGKRYQRLTKGAINLVSAVTRRPFMLAGAQVASTINQGIWEPFKKLIIDTPVKLLKGVRNATRIFSKKKGFDFQTYDTHETTGDTRINQIREKRIGFFGAGGTASNKSEEKSEKPAEIKKEEVKTEAKPDQKPDTKPGVKPTEIKPEPKKIETKPKEILDGESQELAKAIKEKDDALIDKELTERGYPTGGTLGATKKISDAPVDKPKSIDELKQKNTMESVSKDKNEIESKKRKNLGKEDKSKHRKEFEKLLENNLSEEGVLARAKKHNKGNTMEQILRTLDKENITFATFIDDEILAKRTPMKAAG